jgi:error-prone DNA polymerase
MLIRDFFPAPLRKPDQGVRRYGFPENPRSQFCRLFYVRAVEMPFSRRHLAALCSVTADGFNTHLNVRDAAGAQVQVQPVGVNHSAWDFNTLEEFGVLTGYEEDGGRLDKHIALRQQVGGRPARTCPRLEIEVTKREEKEAAPTSPTCRTGRGYCSHIRTTAWPPPTLDHWDCRAGGHLWDARSLVDGPDLPLFKPERGEGAESARTCRKCRCPEEVVAVIRRSALPLAVSFLRASLEAAALCERAICAAAEIPLHGAVAGVVLIRQRPGSAKGVSSSRWRMKRWLTSSSGPI